MKKFMTFLLGFFICLGASAILTLEIVVNDTIVNFKVQQKEIVNDSIYLYGVNKYDIKKIKVDNESITLFTANKTLKYKYNNPELCKTITESVLY